MGFENLFNHFPVIETERLILRKLSIEDVEDMFSYSSNQKLYKYVVWEPHNTTSDTVKFIEFALAQYENYKVIPWGIEYKENKKLIGTIDISSWQPKHRVAEIGYVLSHDYWGRGIATEAANAVIRFGFNHMGLIRIQAKCFVDNESSARVMEKTGMTFEGIIRKGMFAKGKHHDLKMYSILKDEFPTVLKTNR